MKKISAVDVTDKIKKFATDNGVHLLGVAPIDRFRGAPRGHHPTDFLTDCKSVIVIGSRILDRGLDHYSLVPGGSEFIYEDRLRDVMQDYFWEIESHGPTSDLLSMIALRIAMLLQDEGFGSLYFRSSDSDFYGKNYLGDGILPNHSLFSHRHAAVRAGLGEFGLDNIVVTPEYGQRVRFTSILTSAEMIYTPLIDKKVCLGLKCGLCMKNCKEHGVLKIKTSINENEIWLDTVAITDVELCKSISNINHCKGKCIGSCPIGKRV